MSANGISTLSNKQLKQEGKIAIAQAKRQGKVVAKDGTISGSVDSTKNYYRYWNTADIDSLPTKYNGNSITNNANVGGLAAHRPWTSHT
jgi:phosphoribosylformylglycinamidine (FGAM) synthase-like amidotransferase family enzyme